MIILFCLLVITLVLFYLTISELNSGVPKISKLLWTILVFMLSPVFVKIIFMKNISEIFILCNFLLSLYLLIYYANKRKFIYLFLGIFPSIYVLLNLNTSIFETSLPRFVLLFPIFCVMLFPLIRRSDFILFEKKILFLLLFGHIIWAVFIDMGFHQNFLLDLTLVLLLFFPAFDRFVCYGFYFLKKKWMIIFLFLIFFFQISSFLINMNSLL